LLKYKITLQVKTTESKPKDLALRSLAMLSQSQRKLL